jgi:hypothetical protein
VRLEERMLHKLKIVIGLLIAFLFVGGGFAIAQDRYAGSTNAKEHGYQHGYRDGLRQGRSDRNHREEHDFHTSDYKRADRGYERYMGERDDFQEGYRDGYKSGYDDGYSGRPMRADVYGLDDRYDPDRLPRRDEDEDAYRGWGYSDVGFDTGYRDGLQAAREDLRDHKGFHPEKHDAYEDADHGYRKEFGDKKVYKQQYRKGFIRGYQDALGSGPYR